MKVKPLNNRIFVKVIQEAVSSGGIVLTGSDEGVVRGTVVTLGHERELKNGNTVPFTVKKGDVVMFDMKTVTKARVAGEEFVVLGEEDVLAIVE